jgi:hypothetical protein
MTICPSNVIFLPTPLPKRQPLRISLSRRAGFNLQELSNQLNGLPAMNVARPSRWGNPFRVGEAANCVGTPAEAVRLYRVHLLLRLARYPDLLEPLRKKNLACWCPLDCACHADVLLNLANR